MMDERSRQEVLRALIRRIGQLQADAAALAADCERDGAPADVIETLRDVAADLRVLRGR